MARSKDFLTAATTTLWAPFLREYGFQKYTSRSFGRVTNECVFQYIDLQLSAHGSKDFAVNYASALITRLQEYVGSTTFRRLPRGKSHDGWWNSSTHERADQSMNEICETARSVAVPWFQATSTAIGLAQELVSLTVHGNPHTLFELGCCYSTVGNLTEAIPQLQKAIVGFQKAYDEFPQRTWALKERAHVENLLAAITNGTHGDLLSSWQEQTIANLKLQKICD